MPAHTSDILQPLDIANFGPLKAFFRRKVADSLFKLPGVFLNKEDLPKFLDCPLALALSPENIQKGFKKAGIWPVDMDLSKKISGTYKTFEDPRKKAKERPSLFTNSETHDLTYRALSLSNNFPILKKNVMDRYHLDNH